MERVKEMSEIKGLGVNIRKQFPAFCAPSERPFSYLDTAASSQKPKRVIDRLSSFLSNEYANIHRGAYKLSADATASFEQARVDIANFIGARRPEEVIFTRGTTESINLVANSLGNSLCEGDTVLVTILEHHSNIVPWQLLEKRCGIKVAFVDVDDNGSIDIADFEEKLKNLKPKLVGVSSISNAFGSVIPVVEIVTQAKASGALVLLDAAQAVAHETFDVSELDVDFAAFSGHKMYGPTGIGVLYGKYDLLNSLEPFQGGGEMIERVTTEGSTWAKLPQKFEAGTPAIAEAVALGEAVKFIEELGTEAIAAHEAELLAYAFDSLSKIDGIELYGPIVAGEAQRSILSFNSKTVHAHDLATVVDQFNVQLRAGHHCAMPALKRLGIQASSRISFGVYSDTCDIDVLVEALQYAHSLFSK